MGSPRETEAWALTEAARRITEASRKEGATEEFLAAIRLNWRLWTIFQAEMSTDECPLPLELRANMLSLSNFVDRVTVELLADPTLVSKAESLVSINRNLAAGLFSVPTEQPEEPAASDANNNANVSV
ncbi:MAG: flagellar biosynthesis regulator FlaF [Magnetospirillum sp.]|nr:flagellar biosynthesis regulator FlaF [Magnetospirillum sp.]